MNTIISVIDAPRKKVDIGHLVRFVAFKHPFEDVIFSENLIVIEDVKDIFKNDTFRVYPNSIKALYDAGMEYDDEIEQTLDSGIYSGDKWGGKYLRAPDIFFTAIDKGCGYLDKFYNYFIGERYLNTGGADGFFILTNVNKLNNSIWEITNDKATDCNPGLNYKGTIESKYLVPLIKDVTKSSKRIEISEYDAYCLVINDDKLSPKIKAYIKWGELQGYNGRSVTKNQKPWYKPTLQMLSGGEILLPRSFNDTFIVHYNPSKYVSLRFYRLHIKEDKPERLLSFLNSTLFWLIFETLGNKNLGLGAVDFFMADFLRMKIPIILDDKTIPLFKKMRTRDIQPIFIECGIDPSSDTPISKQEPKPLQDRAELDSIIFDALGLTQDERKEVYRAVCQLVWNRISKAKSV